MTRTAALIAALILTACHGGGGGGSPLPQPVASSFVRTAGGKIQHVVIIVQENRSFNNLFYGFPGATTVSYGFDSHNRRIALKPIGLSTSWDLAHNSAGYYAACNGVGSIRGTDCKMNGFDKEQVTCNKPRAARCPIKHPQYAYVPHNETRPYFDMATQYVLADKMFPSNFDASSYVSHQYIIAAQADSAQSGEETTDYPDGGWWGCPGGPADKIGTILSNPPRARASPVPDCFDYRTLGDELDGAGLSWAFYAAPILGSPPNPCGTGVRPDYLAHNGIWSSYQAVKHICYGPDWNKDVIVPQTKFLSDVKNKLRTVTWIVPTCVNSDHPGCNSDTGPSWVSQLVNAIGKSKFWDTTAIFIFWDDYGGFYDPLPPRYLDYDGLGIRVPMIIISPYARRGHVSHVRYEHGSILRFIEERFGLAPLSDSDRRATSPAKDCFDFAKPPRKFVPIRAPYDEKYFMQQPLDLRPPDSG